MCTLFADNALFKLLYFRLFYSIDSPIIDSKDCYVFLSSNTAYSILSINWLIYILTNFIDLSKGCMVFIRYYLLFLFLVILFIELYDMENHFIIVLFILITNIF